MRCIILFSVLALTAVLATSAAPADADSAPAPYAQFIQGATAQHGLFTIWNKEGQTYLELTAGQLDRDYIETIVPGTGLGGEFVVWGNTDHLPAELIRFTREGDSVAILWPNPNFIAPGSNAANALDEQFPKSIVGLAQIVAEDAATGTIVIDTSAFLSDMMDLKDVLAGGLGTSDDEGYHLNSDRTYMGKTESFPRNIVLEVEQNWTTDNATLLDTAPDARTIQLRVVYNIAEPPDDGDYMPRYADDRVGIYDDVYLDFSNDAVNERQLRYIVRWNIQPSDPSKPMSPAKHPMVFYLSNTIPTQYKPAIARGILAWNAAFEKIGISDAIQVVDQPNDPSWNPDDIRYNVIRWVTEANPSFGADSQTLYDPRTGQEFRTGVLVSGDEGLRARQEWKRIVDPVRYGRVTDPAPQWFIDERLFATLLHETGHNMGLQHNFISTLAYTAKQLQDPAFTARNGVATTAMAYAPINIWPRPYGQGDYDQTALGSYGYHAIQYAYAPIPGAKTPEDELPTLQRWASEWSDPRYRYESDEDVQWENGHAADPRATQGVLTNDPLGWCQVQLDLRRHLIESMNRFYPSPGEAYEAETDAFNTYVGTILTCDMLPVHFIGGQYLSRAHRGDPGAEDPVVPVSRADEQRAFAMLDKYLFSESAWDYPAGVLDKLTYSEWAGYGYGVWMSRYGGLQPWAYFPPNRHYQSIARIALDFQNEAIDELFNPLVLQRIDDNPSLAAHGQTMSIGDLFDWLHSGVYGELGAANLASIGEVRRGLQQSLEVKLIALMHNLPEGAPADAQALARAELERLEAAASASLRSPRLDSVTRAHLEWLQANAE
ncbi:MAG TPA: zinc-dependent metalloprotease, partial [Candidatus Eremiobacteraceae bacterium]|nr:zinc-dependent metalloprotease [Candidatus Eremiobacteraceae bacterium]